MCYVHGAVCGWKPRPIPAKQQDHALHFRAMRRPISATFAPTTGPIVLTPRPPAASERAR